MSNYNRITFKERVRIEAGIYAEKSFSQIAKELGRSTSSIVREVKQNRIVIKSPHTNGTGCINAGHCWKRNLCGEEDCPFLCRLCAKHKCAEYCIDLKRPSCKKTEKPPFVCDSCSEKNKKGCKYDKYYYLAEKAEANAKKTRSDSRKGIRLNPKELQMLDEILSPLILQGQPLSHICSVHRDEIGVCERSIYNYIDAGELTICNLDLRRKVRYRKRKKKKDEIKCNKFNYRKGRTYEDFKKYMEIHPDVPMVEMDTVRGSRYKEQVLLTIMFIQCSVMLMILIKDEDQDSVVEFFDWLTKKLGIRRFRRLFQVIVTDNGGCFKDALALEYTKSGAPRTKVFYCDPQASWQKPHIEKNHEFIRYVLPKGKSLKGYTQEDMTLIANHINSTTRPGLGYKSPYDLAVTEDMKKLLEVLNMSPVATDEICLTPKLLSK
ncbi:Transposase and inactivated derivatives, IS30 family [Pseudobutyrivibrio sp. AR14]|uniref:IS30 family transposase n=1 Tax=Pseudobutyrivibrio sp. AR14 TaxID=1520804 RepID=UPI000883257F|nr:IS30 family transposase [Pseudobutyrivibrio sp. AR14]SCY25180.1 Transposase and inactivated derivatives, IS30 family [Pseudobutyrivibrio sp. AR14]